MMLFFWMVFTAKSIPLSNETDTLKKTPGFHLKIYVLADMNIWENVQVWKMLATVNFITSKEVNIHLQYVGIEMRNNWKSMGVTNKTKVYTQILNLAKTIYNRKPYDHLIVLQGQGSPEAMGFSNVQSHMYSFNLTCHQKSIGIIHTPFLAEGRASMTRAIEDMIVSILVSNYMPDPDSECACNSGKSDRCLNLNKSITETTVVRCQKDLFAKAIESEADLKSNKHSCLRRIPDPKQTPRGLEIWQNGILEGDEECDCDYYDDTCYEDCIPPSWKEEHRNRVSRKTRVRYAIIGGIVTMVIIVIMLFLILRRRKKEVTNFFTLNTIQTVDSFKSQSN
jgi:hypothetical protein